MTRPNSLPVHHQNFKVSPQQQQQLSELVQLVALSWPWAAGVTPAIIFQEEEAEGEESAEEEVEEVWAAPVPLRALRPSVPVAPYGSTNLYPVPGRQR